MKFFINKTQRQRFVQKYRTSQNFLSLVNENYIKSNAIGKSSQLQQERNTNLHPNEVRFNSVVSSTCSVDIFKYLTF